MNPTSHYFTTPADGDFNPRLINVRLRGTDYELFTEAGVFSTAHLDLGTKVLLDRVPEPPAGPLLDLGCGWGPIALSMALARPEAEVWAVDVNERALDLTARNAKKLGLSNVRTATPEQVPTDLQFAAIWSNPPIRVGKAALHELLDTWLPRLASPILSDDEDATGENTGAFLVVARNLGADSLANFLQESKGYQVERIGSAKGFRVLRVR